MAHAIVVRVYVDGLEDRQGSGAVVDALEDVTFGPNVLDLLIRVACSEGSREDSDEVASKLALIEAARPMIAAGADEQAEPPGLVSAAVPGSFH